MTGVTQLILASASPSRRRMLEQAGLAFDTIPSGVDEDEAKRSLVAARATAGDIARHLAELKARAVSTRHPGALVIGADSTLSCEGRLFDKPVDRQAAKEQLRALAGRTHELCSAAVAAQDGVRLWHHSDAARLTMRNLSADFLDIYLARAGDSVLGSVGAYQLEKLGVHLFARIEGDYFTILGLPLLPLLSFLELHGIGLVPR